MGEDRHGSVFEAVGSTGMVAAWAGATLDDRGLGAVAAREAVVAACMVAAGTGTCLREGGPGG